MNENKYKYNNFLSRKFVGNDTCGYSVCLCVGGWVCFVGVCLCVALWVVPSMEY